jgi:hypothetical protein
MIDEWKPHETGMKVEICNLYEGAKKELKLMLFEVTFFIN